MKSSNNLPVSDEELFNDKKDKPEFSKRLAKKRKQAGYTQEEFSQAFDDKFNTKENKSFYETLKKYETGKSLPFKQTIFQVCEILGNCDPGYLLGIYDESKKDFHDISEITGLSEGAIKQLHQLALKKDGRSANTLNLINELLCTHNGNDFVSSLVFLREVVFPIDYQIRNQYWTTDSSVEGLHLCEREVKFSILEAQEAFQRFVYDQLEARSALKGLSQLIHSIPDDYGPPPEEDQEQ
ncbi:MAG: hypothetical protein IJJ43_01180 [Oscillospiraceae bacterium]|nr:hypothetical protein [Oscillospiraceae bacterium]